MALAPRSAPRQQPCLDVAVVSSLTGVLLLVAALLVGPLAVFAHAGGPQRSALCAGREICAITPTAQVNVGEVLQLSVRGNSGARLDLQIYSVQFNRSGALTGLVPVGDVETRTTQAAASNLSVPMIADTRTVSGWGFLGLTEEAGQAPDQRLGAFFGFGGASTMLLLGDGYAEQKPTGTPLEMHVVGTQPKVKYWVEYRNDSGTWTAVPGQGMTNAQSFETPSNEVAGISYQVPAHLTRGQGYEFRITSNLNYTTGGNLVATPAFTEWTVVPSATGGVEQDRGKNFDPSLAPGKPDPTNDPTTGPTAPPSAVPTHRPSVSTPGPGDGTGSAGPSGQPAIASPAAPTAPSGTGAPTAVPSGPPSPSPTPSASATASASARPTAGASGPSAPSGMVWGAEELGTPVAANRPAGRTVSGLLTVVGAVLLAGPLLWWLAHRHRTRTRPEDTL